MFRPHQSRFHVSGLPKRFRTLSSRSTKQNFKFEYLVAFEAKTTDLPLFFGTLPNDRNRMYGKAQS